MTATPMTAPTAPVMQAESLTRHYGVSQGFMKPKVTVKALVDVSFTLTAGQTLAEATQAVIDEIGSMGGDGGMIALDASGNIAAPFNSQGMKRAWLTPDGEIGVEVFGR